jgi:hypothetical protein
MGNMSEESLTRDTMLAELGFRVWQISLFEEGRLTTLEDGTPVTQEVVQRWREEIAELRRLTQTS